MPSRRSLLKALVTLGALAVLLVPAVVVFGLGWIRVQSPEAYPRQEQTPIEAWAALALFYILWVGLVLAGLIAALDRLGYKYTPVEQPPYESRRKKRRRAAGLGYLRAREEASRVAAAKPRKKRPDQIAPADAPDRTKTRAPRQHAGDGAQDGSGPDQRGAA